MEFPHIITFLSLLMIVSHAAEAQTYWKSVLPNTPMPKAIADLLHNDKRSETDVGRPQSSIGVGKPGVVSDAAVTGYVADVQLLFLEKDMHQGHEMMLKFTKTISSLSSFLPREVADTIPLSSKYLPELYTRFSIKPGSKESASMKKTIRLCEEKRMEGEKKYCATSLEAMVEYVTSKLGKNVNAISTEVNDNNHTPLQKYTMQRSKMLATNRYVVCHKQNYPYAVFYCHKFTSTRAYSVSLVGEDGTKVKAVAICHTNTAKLYSKDVMMRVLKVKPGTTPICHILPQDHVVWVPN